MDKTKKYLEVDENVMSMEAWVSQKEPDKLIFNFWTAAYLQHMTRFSTELRTAVLINKAKEQDVIYAFDEAGMRYKFLEKYDDNPLLVEKVVDFSGNEIWVTTKEQTLFDVFKYIKLFPSKEILFECLEQFWDKELVKEGFDETIFFDLLDTDPEAKRMFVAFSEYRSWLMYHK